MTTPSYRSADIWRSIPSSGNGPRTFTKPAGTVSGDVLLLFLLWGVGSGATSSWTMPSGFTEVVRLEDTTFEYGLSVWRKEAGGSEPATYDFESTAGTTVGYGFLAAYQDGDPAGSLDSFGSSGATLDSGDATANIAGITTASANTRVISFVAEVSGAARTFTAVAPLVERADSGQDGVSGYSAGIFDEVVASVGAISGRTATASDNGTFRSITIALKGVATAPVITGPSGPAGAASSTANVAENATTGPTFNWTVPGTLALSGTDAARWTATTLSTLSGRLDPNPAKDFETPLDAGANNVHDVIVTVTAATGGLTAAQSCAITITNVNETPTFSGTLSVPNLTQGVAMTPVNTATLFADPDSGDTGTYSKVGTWPTGVDVNSAGMLGAAPNGTPSASGSFANLRVRRTDGGGLTVDSNLFTITVAPPGGATCTILDWVLPTDSQHNVGEVWNISYHSVANRALALHVPAAALVAGLNGAGQASRNLAVQNAAFVAGTTYDWFATHPTNSTWFASGKVTAA